MARISLIALAFALGAGCVMDPADNDGAQTGSIESAVTISPLAGTWTYGELTPVSTTCNTTLAQGESGPFAIDTVTASSFRVVPNDGTVPFTCTSGANGQFNCPNRATGKIDLRPSLIDAQLTIRVTATGVFLDNSRARGKQDAVVTCAGTQCSSVGPMPCGFVVNFAAHM